MIDLQYSQFKQSLVQVVALICTAVLFVFLAAMVIFISLQGGRYFLPGNIYQVTETFPNGSVEIYFEESSESLQDFTKALEQRASTQFALSPRSAPSITTEKKADILAMELKNGQKLYGYFVGLKSPLGEHLTINELNNLLDTVEILGAELTEVQQTKLAPLHESLSLMLSEGVTEDAPAMQESVNQFNRWQSYADSVSEQMNLYQIEFLDANGAKSSLALERLRYFSMPNDASFFDKVMSVIDKVWNFLSDSPKQAASAGGVFPAIFGTVLMIFIMTLIVAPFGMIAAIYLHEYAPTNQTTELIRVGISNMAAVPSVVYGVFGLGFFVYTLGGSIDELFYAEALPSPTFGTPGLFWASLTMGLLTLPVVIVSAEEGLRRVPKGLREGSYALGATKFETIQKVVLPMASPGMLTGVILAIARAAGEVAPLILVGAVKFAPTLPIDGNFPFMHLERQFMHLGVFIYDGAFHNQVDSSTSSLMFASCMLLLIIVFLLNLAAVLFRKRLRERYERSLI